MSAAVRSEAPQLGIEQLLALVQDQLRLRQEFVRRSTPARSALASSGISSV